MTVEVYPVFLSVVCVMRNQAESQEQTISRLADSVSLLVSDYEIIVIDNASSDESVAGLKRLTREHGLANVQVFALTKEVDSDTAAWVGLENALGDFSVVIDPQIDDIDFLPEMLHRASTGSDVVFANNRQKPSQNILYRLAQATFNTVYRWSTGINLLNEAPQYRVLSKGVLNFILQHPHPALTYRHLPASGGFSKANLSYSAIPQGRPHKRLGDSVERGMRLLMSTSRAPMRLVTSLCLFGAFSNIVYSVYVVVVGFFKSDVAPGWISLSLQQSGMFFLMSLVLLVLGEYIINMTRLSDEGPAYHVGQEFTSARMTRLERLNVEVAANAGSDANAPLRVVAAGDVDGR